MPIPFILGGLALAAAGYGVKKGIDAKDDQDTANRLNESAQEIVDKATKRAKSSRTKCSNSIQKLGNQKIQVLNESVIPFIEIFKKINNIELEESRGLEELKKLKIDKNFFVELRQMGDMASSLAGGIASGTAMGAVTAFGAYGIAGTLGVASTGTAIGTLTGAAATNATLAFLGGGAISAGGLGIAGGTAVLGGLVAGPALAVLGACAASKAEANKEKAYANIAKARRFEEEMNTVATLCNGIGARARLFDRLLAQLDEIFVSQTNALITIIQNTGCDYRKYDLQEKQVVAGSLSTLTSIKAILDTPILSENGTLTPESQQIAQATEMFLAEHEA
ncbi:hypothetical protein [Phascolarctobacterium sp.]|uniref:hypothetical protein n=1 Tax=Phascolarctobacterium sp. TaxID=2049039 RepID=UPI0038682429